MKRILEELVGKVGMGKAFLQIPETLTCMYTVLAAFHTFWNLNLKIDTAHKIYKASVYHGEMIG